MIGATEARPRVSDADSPAPPAEPARRAPRRRRPRPLLLGALVVALLAAVVVQPAWPLALAGTVAWIGGAWRQVLLLVAAAAAGGVLVANTVRPRAAWEASAAGAGR